MCRISKETAIRANEALRVRSRIGQLAVSPSPLAGEINVSTRICGRTYSRKLTFDEIKSAYGISLQIMKESMTGKYSTPDKTAKIS